MLITSVNNTHIKEINKLKEKKYRDSTNTFIIEGEHLVIEAYRAGLIKELIILENEKFTLDVPTIYVSKEVMKKLSSMESAPKIMAIVYKKKEEEVGNRVLVLEDIQDPGNLGTIIRSSLAFGVDTLVLSPKTVDLYNPKVIRATKGMLFHLNIIVREIVPFISSLKKDNYKIYGTKVEKGEDIRKLNISSKFALVMGNEGQGMSNEVSSLCDNYLYIKMDNRVESLNVAVASSILLYEVFNKNEFNKDR